jgi:putative transposase
MDVTPPAGTPHSCPLDTPHLWAALRYTELNPVRAGLVTCATDYFWSSARAHGGVDADAPLVPPDLAVWRRSWTPGEWLAYVADGSPEIEARQIRSNTHTGRPLGTDEFVRELEAMLERRLPPAPGGRPSKQRRDDTQIALGFAP